MSYATAHSLIRYYIETIVLHTIDTAVFLTFIAILIMLRAVITGSKFSVAWKRKIE
jgi:hypothetical protein